MEIDNTVAFAVCLPQGTQEQGSTGNTVSVSRQNGERARDRRVTGRPNYRDKNIHWLRPRKTLLWLLVGVLLLALLLPLILVDLVPTDADGYAPCDLLQLRLLIGAITGVLVAAIVPVLWLVKRITDTRIGVLEEWVLVDRGGGRVLYARDEDLLRVNKGFIIHTTQVPLGSPPATLYEPGELAQWLEPRLAQARMLSPVQQLIWQWRNKRHLFIATVLALAMLAGLAVSVETGHLEERAGQWLEQQPACRERQSVK